MEFAFGPCPLERGVAGMALALGGRALGWFAGAWLRWAREWPVVALGGGGGALVRPVGDGGSGALGGLVRGRGLRDARKCVDDGAGAF